MQDLRFLVFLLEGLAAICGLYFYKKNPTIKTVGFFSYFLLLTFFVETIGWFPAIIYWNTPLHFLKDSFWYRNFWLFNPYLIISFLVYILYFKWNISRIRTRFFLYATSNRFWAMVVDRMDVVLCGAH